MPTSDDLLDRFADILIDATSDDDDPTRTLLVHLARRPDADDPEAIDLGIKDLEGEHVGEAIMGFTAPESWWAFGAITGGWAAPLPPDAEHELPRGRTSQRPSAHPDAVRIRSVFLLARDGRCAARVRFADGRSIDEPPGAGVTPDAFRRALGLPTDPPAVPVSELYLSLWLSFVIRAGDAARVEGARRLSWPQVVRLHPALGEHRPRRRDASPDAVATAITAALADLDWSEVRRWAMRGSLGPLVERDLARWMDEGMLARWLLGGMAPLPWLLDDAASRVTPEAKRLLGETVDHLVLSATKGDAA